MEALLELSCRYDIKDGIRAAIREFEHMGPLFEPCCQLYMAIRYHIDAWFEPAFCALLQPDAHLNKLSQQDVHFLNGFAYRHLVNTRSELEQFRLSLMWYEPPYQQHFLCLTPGRCEAAWKFQWWVGILQSGITNDM